MTTAAATAERLAREAATHRSSAEEGLPALREEDAIAAAILQRLMVQRDSLSDQERQAQEQIETLKKRITQLDQDIAREQTLNRDAGETIERLEWELRELDKASTGQDEKVEEAQASAHEAADVLQTREADLAQITEDVARLAARYQSAERYIGDCQRAVARGDVDAEKARASVEAAEQHLETASGTAEDAMERLSEAQAMAEEADVRLSDSEAARAECLTLEAEARSERSEAEGMVNALRAEVTALAPIGRTRNRRGRADFGSVASGTGL